METATAQIHRAMTGHFTRWIDNIRNIMPLLNATAQPESVVSCLEEPPGSGMGRTLELFWNTSFTLMIVTALIGNSAVLWIVISTSQHEINYNFTLTCDNRNRYTKVINILALSIKRRSL